MIAPRGRLAQNCPQAKDWDSDAEGTVIVKGLLEHGIVVPIASGNIFQCCGKPFLNVAFVVPKGACKEGQPLRHHSPANSGPTPGRGESELLMLTESAATYSMLCLWGDGLM
eukprot:2785307-Amphidinium_carterae.1